MAQVFIASQSINQIFPSTTKVENATNGMMLALAVILRATLFPDRCVHSFHWLPLLFRLHVGFWFDRCPCHSCFGCKALSTARPSGGQGA
jgi:hypothetical protein